MIFSDASAYDYGGFSVTKKGKQLAKGIFSGAEMETSSTSRELLAVKYVLESFGEELVGQNILWYTDNQNVPIILRKGSTKLHLNQISDSFRNFCFFYKTKHRNPASMDSEG